MFFYTQGDGWNVLSVVVVEVDVIVEFKRVLSRHINMLGMVGFPCRQRELV